MCRRALIAAMASIVLLLGGSLIPADEPVNDASDNPFEQVPRIVYAAPVRFLPEDNPDSPEALAKYLESAIRFLDECPESRDAPRAALDAMLAATIMKNEPVATKLRMRLLFDYPRSFQAAAMVSAIPDAAQIRQLLMRRFERPDNTYGELLSRRFLKASELGLNRFGDAFVNDSAYLAQLAFALRDSRHFQLEQILRERVKQERPLLQQCILQIMDRSKSNPETIAGLARLGREDYLIDRLIKIPQSMLLQCCTTDELATTDVRRVALQVAWLSGEIGKAREIAARLVDTSPTEEHLFAQAYLALVDEDIATARPVLEKLAAGSTDSPWHTIAKELLAIALIDGRLENQIRELKPLLQQLKNNSAEILEVRIRYVVAPEKILTGYIGSDATQDLWDIQLWKNDESLGLFHTSNTESKYYLAGDAALTSVSKPVNVPEGTFELTPKENGDFGFALNTAQGGTTSKAPVIRRLIENLAGVPEELLKGCLRSNAKTTRAVVGSIRKDDNGVEFSWLQCEPFKHESVVTRVRINAATGHIAVNRADGLSVTLHLSPAGSKPLSPPTWPKLPEVSRTEHDGAMMFRALGFGAKIMEELQNAPPPSEAALSQTEAGQPQR